MLQLLNVSINGKNINTLQFCWAFQAWLTTWDFLLYLSICIYMLSVQHADTTDSFKTTSVVISGQPLLSE